jgi:D-galactonate transporter
MFVCYIVAYLDRVNIGFAKLQMLHDLNFTNTMYGLGAGLFFISYFIFEVPSNVILHRIGARIWIARIMISWGIISSLTMFVTTPWMFYVMRFLLGIAEAGFFPGMILYVTYFYPAQRRGAIFALLVAGNPVAGVIGGPLSGWIMTSLAGLNGWAGWQWLFLLEGLPSIIVGIIVYFYLTDSIRLASWLPEEEKQILEKNLQAESKDKQSHSLRDAFSSGMVWLLSFIYFCLIMGVYGLMFWMPTLIKATGVKSVLNVGLLSAIPFAAAVVAMVWVCRSSDKHQERRWHCAIPALISCVCLIISTVYMNNTLVAMIALTIGVAAGLATTPIFWSLPTAFLGGTAAAAGIALINSVGNLSGFLGNYVIGWLTDLTHSTNAGVYVLAAFALMAAIATMLVPAKLVDK